MKKFEIGDLVQSHVNPGRIGRVDAVSSTGEFMHVRFDDGQSGNFHMSLLEHIIQPDGENPELIANANRITRCFKWCMRQFNKLRASGPGEEYIDAVLTDAQKCAIVDAALEREIARRVALRREKIAARHEKLTKFARDE